ncbi:MAG: glycosyltransferase family 39 protein [Herpetosiphonaceae bacterium]|nr:glycosyltransferase family 39 protein [Herpetosiphonaceae bacterium]
MRDALRLRHWQPIYTDANSYPYVVSVYPPVFPLVAAILSYVTGATLLTTRLVAAISVVFTSLIIAAIVRKITLQLVPALVVGFVYASTLFVYQWGVFGRVDTLAVLLSLTAVLIIMEGVTSKHIVWAAVCCVSAIYAKQTSIAAPVAIAVYLAMLDRRSVISFVILTGILGGSILLVLIWLTHGQFYLQILRYNVQSYSLRTFASYMRAFVLLHLPILIGACMYGMVSIYRRRMTLPLLYACTSGAMIWTIGRSGASISYLLEFIAALLILFGIGWAWLTEYHPRWAFLMPLLLILHLVWQNVLPYTAVAQYYKPDPVFGYNPTGTDVASCRKLDPYVEQTAGPVLAEEAGIVVTHGKEAIGSPWLFNILRGKGLIDTGYTRLEAAVTQHQFSLVLLHWQSYPSDFLFSVANHYRKIDTVPCIQQWQVYVR